MSWVDETNGLLRLYRLNRTTNRNVRPRNRHLMQPMPSPIRISTYRSAIVPLHCECILEEKRRKERKKEEKEKAANAKNLRRHGQKQIIYSITDKSL
ncbi:hypothetical protein QQG55_36185 [Brugia pahangi]